MGLRREKAAPAQLEPKVFETIWPGDDAVDLEASDLVQWCREGGKAGLVLKQDGRPDIIRWRPLDEFAFGRVSAFLFEKSRNLPLVAFRHGVISIDGETLPKDRLDDAEGLHDEAMRSLSAHRMPLPLKVAMKAMRGAMGLEVKDEEGDEVVMMASLPQVVGCHILAATFRTGRDAA